MKNKIIIFCICLFSVSYSCYAKQHIKVPLCFAKVPEIVDIFDSISHINTLDKPEYRGETFMVTMRKDGDKFSMLITEGIFGRKFFKEYNPFGCVVFNDSQFFLVNENIEDSLLNLIFLKTDIQIIPRLSEYEDSPYTVINGEIVYWVFRPSKYFYFPIENLVISLKKAK